MSPLHQRQVNHCLNSLHQWHLERYLSLQLPLCWHHQCCSSHRYTNSRPLHPGHHRFNSLHLASGRQFRYLFDHRSYSSRLQPRWPVPHFSHPSLRHLLLNSHLRRCYWSGHRSYSSRLQPRLPLPHFSHLGRRHHHLLDSIRRCCCWSAHQSYSSLHQPRRLLAHFLLLVRLQHHLLAPAPLVPHPSLPRPFADLRFLYCRMHPLIHRRHPVTHLSHFCRSHHLTHLS